MITDHDNRVLIIDDEVDLCDIISHVLTREGYTTYTANSGNTGIELFHKTFPHVVVLDLCMPGKNGIEVLKQIKDISNETPVIIITAYGEIRSAIEATKLGAYDYFTKPFDNEQIVLAVKRAIEERLMRQEIHTLKAQFGLAMTLFEQMGSSSEIAKINEMVERVAPTNFTVLIYGETGSGKELVARNIHNRSPRRDKPFIIVDCGSIPETLIESELFGFEKGAFTGAEQKKIGQFEAACGGTIFLDEIGNLPKSMQGKLLRVLQERHIRRLGSNKEVEIDVRVVAAGNERLELLVESGQFRMDLYQRLNEFCIEIPTLRHRKEDIVFLCKRFLDITNKELDKNIRGINKEALEVLLAYEWPGNVRELKNVIRRAVLLASEIIEAKHLTIKIGRTKQHHSRGEQQPGTLPRSIDYFSLSDLGFDDGKDISLHSMVAKHVEMVEKEIIEKVLKWTNGNKSQAAKILKIDYKTMHYKVKNYGIKIRMKTEITHNIPNVT